MTVWVDSMRPAVRSRRWLYPESCHLFGDDLHELHDLAQSIGLRPGWFQTKASMPHYDLTRTLRRLAVRAGAVALNSNAEVVEKMRLARGGTKRRPVLFTFDEHSLDKDTREEALARCRTASERSRVGRWWDAVDAVREQDPALRGRGRRVEPR